jgi:hypothetical protein
MAMGPLELVVLSVPRDRLDDGAYATLRKLTAGGEMRVVDVLVVRAGADGRPQAVELSERPGLRGLAGLTSGLITAVDVAEVGLLVDDGTDALAVLLEHRWLRELERHVAGAKGSVVALTHISGAPVAVAH